MTVIFSNVWVSSLVRGLASSAALVSALVLALVLGGCAALSPGPRTYTVSQSQLLELIAKKFPFNSRVAELLDVEVLAPRIKLLPDANRVATELDVVVSERLLRNSFQGLLAMDYGLRFEPRDNSIRLTGVRVSRLQFSGVPDRFQPTVNTLAPFFAERLLNDLTLHQISAKDLAVVQGWGYAPDAFKISPEGLSITLAPRKEP
jgi:hypothetical protein